MKHETSRVIVLCPQPSERKVIDSILGKNSGQQRRHLKLLGSLAKVYCSYSERPNCIYAEASIVISAACQALTLFDFESIWDKWLPWSSRSSEIVIISWQGKWRICNRGLREVYDTNDNIMTLRHKSIQYQRNACRFVLMNLWSMLDRSRYLSGIVRDYVF